MITDLTSHASLLKKGPWHRCFPVNFATFLRTPFFTEHLQWLLLSIGFTKNNTWRKCCQSTSDQKYSVCYYLSSLIREKYWFSNLEPTFGKVLLCGSYVKIHTREKSVKFVFVKLSSLESINNITLDFMCLYSVQQTLLLKKNV